MQARHLVWPMFGTITTSTLAVLLTWWLVSINSYKYASNCPHLAVGTSGHH